MSTKSYKDAGVDIDAGNAMVNAIKPFVKATKRPGVLGDIGGFGGLFDLKQAGYQDPILVAATDGVGTKLKVAFQSGIHDSIGIDLVAMCVNDLGAVERANILDGSKVREGDLILGLASSGLHSNGYSLVRKVISDVGLDYDDPAPFAPDFPFQDILLSPTRIYVKSCLEALKGGGVHAMAHITGGGLLENLPRVFGDTLCASLRLEALDVPPVFRWLARAGGIAPEEMLRTFNCGIGMALIINPESQKEIEAVLSQHGEKTVVLGEITSRSGGNPVVCSGFDLK